MPLKVAEAVAAAQAGARTELERLEQQLAQVGGCEVAMYAAVPLGSLLLLVLLRLSPTPDHMFACACCLPAVCLSLHLPCKSTSSSACCSARRSWQPFGKRLKRWRRRRPP